METLRLKPRQPVENEIENWDDDDDFVVEGDELSLRSSTAAAGVPQRRRDSTSSHISLRSDLDSLHGEEQHVHLPGDDERSTMAAIAAAERAGIPLPKNVPSSALTGGTIRRLGGRRIRKIVPEDWDSDLELPDPSQGLQMKLQDQPEFPETLRQVSGGSVQSSPQKPTKFAFTIGQGNRRLSTISNVSALSAAISLDRFKDTDDDDDFFGDDVDTIKVSKHRMAMPPQPTSFITPPTPQKPDQENELEDDFERDLELPSDGKLKLSTRRDIPRTPLSQSDDLDWGEGSLGTRYGGTRRDGRSNRSSSVSALSPSLSSTFTAESEDETFDGILLPPGPLNFQERLHLRKKIPQPDQIPEEPAAPTPFKKFAAAEADRQDFLEGLEIGDGDVFESGKLTLHRNIKIKDYRPASPNRPKAAVSLTFTNKPAPPPPQTRIPRLNNHERSHSTALEPVSESGGPILQRVRRPQSRLGGHSSQSSISSLPTPTSAPSGLAMPPTPRRGDIGNKSSFSSLRSESSTTSAQLLRQKRSMPGVRALNPSTKPLTSRPDRPPSRTDSSRPQSGMRPKTPVERQRPASQSPSQTRKQPIPFLPAGASQAQSKHRDSKAVRQFRRHDSENAIDIRPISRSFSRTGLRSPSPQRYRVAADTWERLSKPKNKKHFGDGHELDGFDDLPTSKETESRFLKQPIAGGPKTTLRRVPQTIQQSIQQPDRTQTPSPWSPQPSGKSTSMTPSFARDTAASRIARETSLAHRTPSSGPLASVSAQRASTRQQPLLSQQTTRSKKSKRPQQLKPHLISNLNSDKESKANGLSVVNGMFYNAETYRWEGNDNALNAFDAAVSTPSTTSVPCHMAREKETATLRPALITNISATKGVQVVGGMVFDPQNMCWLKLGPQSMAKSEATDSLDGFNGVEEEEDVFKDIPDLEDSTADNERDGRTSDIKDDWLVGEEFDVGPEFIRRQREEEERWRKKCEKWTSRGPRDRDAWRWTIRELVSQFDELTMPNTDEQS